MQDKKITLDSLETGIVENTQDMFEINEPFSVEIPSPSASMISDDERKVLLENAKRFAKSLNPEYKAMMVYNHMSSHPDEFPNIPRVGHQKRIYMRALIRSAKKGKLDKFFIQKD